MKLIDQNNQPINDPSTLPHVEPAVGSIPAILVTGPSGFPPILGTTGVDEQGGGEPTDDEEQDPKYSRRDYLILRLRRMRSRLDAYSKQLNGRTEHLPFMMAVASLDVALSHAVTLPADWKPVRPSAPSTDLAVGSRVAIRARFRKIYQEDLSEADMDGLVVDRVGEKRLRCKTSGGALVLIPSGHVNLCV